MEYSPVRPVSDRPVMPGNIETGMGVWPTYGEKMRSAGPVIRSKGSSSGWFFWMALGSLLTKALEMIL